MREFFDCDFFGLVVFVAVLYGLYRFVYLPRKERKSSPGKDKPGGNSEAQ